MQGKENTRYRECNTMDTDGTVIVSLIIKTRAARDVMRILPEEEVSMQGRSVGGRGGVQVAGEVKNDSAKTGLFRNPEGSAAPDGQHLVAHPSERQIFLCFGKVLDSDFIAESIDLSTLDVMAVGGSLHVCSACGVIPVPLLFVLQMVSYEVV